MQQVRSDHVYQSVDPRRDCWATNREHDALVAENEGLIWTRIRNVNDRAFDALLQGCGV